MPVDPRLRPHDVERVTPVKQRREEGRTHSSGGIDASGRDAKTESSFDDDRLDIDELAVACRAVLVDQHGKSAAFADRRHAVMPSPSIVVDPRATAHSEGAKCLEV